MITPDCLREIRIWLNFFKLFQKKKVFSTIEKKGNWTLPNRVYYNMADASIKKMQNFMVDSNMSNSETLASILETHSSDLPGVDLDLISKKVASLSRIGTFSKRLTELARICGDNGVVHYQWGILAGRMMMVVIHDQIPSRFSESIAESRFLLNQEYANFVAENEEELDSMIVPDRDWSYNVFSVSTLKKTYLLCIKRDGVTKIMESPQYMWLRVASFIHYPNLEKIKEVYDDMSQGYYTHATPTLCNAGLKRSQMASCFLATIGDSLQSISKGWHDSAIISMNMGGIGKDCSELRHSEIGSNGESRGVPPWIMIEAQIMRSVDQGGQKRKGSQTAFLSDWHVDVYEFLDMRKETTPEDMRAMDMTYGLIISDEFMRRVEEDEEWTLFCPNKAKGLATKWGIDFEMAYRTYEAKYNVPQHEKKVYVRKVRARELWQEIIRSQYETGMPFIIYKDSINRKNNQQHLGTLRSSNLCVEINEYTDENEIASCNLASMAFPKYVMTRDDGSKYFDFDLLMTKTRRVVRNLNNVIDRNYYPDDIPQIKFANLKNRPLGIGDQGLADVFAMMDLLWESEEASLLQEDIHEAMYYAAVDESSRIAEELGESHASHPGSPMSRGLFQFDLWEMEKKQKEMAPGEATTQNVMDLIPSHNAPGRIISSEKWNDLRARAKKWMRNSLLIAIMPTASSASILGNNECIEPITENIYARSVLGGQFIMMNKHLVDELHSRGLWITSVVSQIIQDGGSIKNILPDLDDKEWVKHLKKKYKTVFEIPQRVLVDMALKRGKYVCQAQSLNCWMKRDGDGDSEFKRLNNFHFYQWKGGAKTGMYYLRSKPLTQPIGIALDTFSIPKKKGGLDVVCDGDVCVMCQA